MVRRLFAGLAALASYYLLLWFAGGAITDMYPHAMDHALVSMVAGAALGAALPVGFLVFQLAARAVDHRRRREDGAAPSSLTASQTPQRG